MTEEKCVDKKIKSAVHARWSYVVLAIFIILCVFLLTMFLIKYVNDNNHAWCDIIRASLPSTPPKLPAHPTAVQLKQYHDYQLVVKLGRNFGCI